MMAGTEDGGGLLSEAQTQLSETAGEPVASHGEGSKHGFFSVLDRINQAETEHCTAIIVVTLMPCMCSRLLAAHVPRQAYNRDNVRMNLESGGHNIAVHKIRGSWQRECSQKQPALVCGILLHIQVTHTLNLERSTCSGTQHAMSTPQSSNSLHACSRMAWHPVEPALPCSAVPQALQACQLMRATGPSTVCGGAAHWARLAYRLSGPAHRSTEVASSSVAQSPAVRQPPHSR